MPQPSRHVTARISFRKGTTAEWSASDPILMEAEPSVDTTVNKFKIGDGESRWSQLSYIQNMASTSQEWANTGTIFPNGIQSPEEAINFLGEEQENLKPRVIALETEIDGGSYE